MIFLSLKEKLIVKTIDTHTMGDPTRIVVGGMPEVEGDTIFEKKQNLIKKYDYIRSSLILEPRGHRDMFGAILFPPTNETADIGVVFMDTQSYLNMCGHGSIGVVTAILEEGIVEKTGDVVQLVLDTPAGLVNVEAKREGDKVTEVSVINVAAFPYVKDQLLTIPGFKDIRVDVSFGGSFYVIVDADAAGISLDVDNTSELASLGMKIRDIANEQIKVEHPENKEINTIDLTLFVASSKNEGVNTKNVAVFGEAQVARSACGTGLSAQMATQFGKGKLKIGESYNTESIIETVFKGVLLEEKEGKDYPFVVPKISGNANVISKNEFILDPRDQLVEGFLLNRKDTISTLKVRV